MPALLRVIFTARRKFPSEVLNDLYHTIKWIALCTFWEIFLHTYSCSKEMLDFQARWRFYHSSNSSWTMKNKLYKTKQILKCNVYFNIQSYDTSLMKWETRRPYQKVLCYWINILDILKLACHLKKWISGERFLLKIPTDIPYCKVLSC